MVMGPFKHYSSAQMTASGHAFLFDGLPLLGRERPIWRERRLDGSLNKSQALLKACYGRTAEWP